MQLAAAPDQVFPLLCPTREYDWIVSWKCRWKPARCWNWTVHELTLFSIGVTLKA